MKSHQIDYKIIGEDIQLVEIELDPMEIVIAEAGAMVYLEVGITFETRMGDGSEPNQRMLGKLLSAGSRVLAGESLFMTHFTNRGHAKSRVAFSAPYPATVIPINLARERKGLVAIHADTQTDSGSVAVRTEHRQGKQVNLRKFFAEIAVYE